MVDWNQLEALEEFPPEALNHAGRNLLVQVMACEGVVPQSLTINRHPEEGWILVSFNLDTGQIPNLEANNFLQIELVGLVFKDSETIGISAPVSCLMLRPDFPREINHLNSTSPEQPASPCIAWLPLSDLYEIGGIQSIIDRVHLFCSKCRTDTLNAETWHPVPIQCSSSYCGMVELQKIQELARDNVGSFVIGYCDPPPDTQIDWYRFWPSPLHSNTHRGKHDLRSLLTGSKSARATFPWVLISTDNPDAPNAPFFQDFSTLHDIKTAAEPVFGQTLDDALAAIELEKFNWRRGQPYNDHALGVILAVKRPVPLEGTSVFLSNDPQARRFEIHAYIVDNIVTGSHPSEANGNVQEILPYFPPTHELYRQVSGTSQAPKLMIFGFGAIGSYVVNDLLRCGIIGMGIADHDFFSPHNGARHIGQFPQIPDYKINVAEKLAKSLLWEGSDALEFPFDRDNVLDIPEAQFSERLNDFEIIVDCTANPFVRRRLASVATSVKKPQIRSELYHDGKMGVTFVHAGNSSQDLQDLYYQFLAQAIEKPNCPQALWLAEERLGKEAQSELVVGQGCASLTTVLPNHIIQQHTGTLSAFIANRLKTDITGSGIGINNLDENGLPTGFHWNDADEMVHFEQNGWKVHVSSTVMGRLTEWRAERLPIETGGYLFGGIDYDLNRLTVVDCSWEPKGSIGSKTGFDLAPLTNDNRAPVIARRTAGRLYCIGSWHSHPGTSSDASDKDHQTHAKHSEIDELAGVPSLMLIIADKSVSVIVGRQEARCG